MRRRVVTYIAGAVTHEGWCGIAWNHGMRPGGWSWAPDLQSFAYRTDLTEADAVLACAGVEPPPRRKAPKARR